MSRFYARITNGGKPVQREGHSRNGIGAHVYGARYGVRVQARADGPADTFDISVTDGATIHAHGPDRPIGAVDGTGTFTPIS